MECAIGEKRKANRKQGRYTYSPSPSKAPVSASRRQQPGSPGGLNVQDTGWNCGSMLANSQNRAHGTYPECVDVESERRVARRMTGRGLDAAWKLASWASCARNGGLNSMAPANDGLQQFCGCEDARARMVLESLRRGVSPCGFVNRRNERPWWRSPPLARTRLAFVA